MVFWKLPGGFWTHFGSIFEVKINRKCIKNGVDFSIDFLIDFRRVLGMILGGSLNEKSMKNK